MEFRSFALSHVGKVRSSNQDRVAAYPEMGLFLLADGMGGHEGGEIASSMAIESVHAMLAPAGILERWIARLSWRREPADPGIELRRAIEVANQRIFAAGEVRARESDRRPMGTTVVALHCNSKRATATWAHVGDSRLYHVRAGVLRLLTADHTSHGELYAVSGDDETAPEVPISLPHTNHLTRALGTSPAVEVSMGQLEFRVHDRFVLCSDGVSGMVAPEEMESALLSDWPPRLVGERLIQAALDAGGKDNASVVVMEIVAD